MTEDRSLVISWLNRGTLHLVRSEDFHWLHALTTHRQATMVQRRLAEEGVSPRQAERGAETIRRSLAVEGPLTRNQLREKLEAGGIPTAGQAMVHLLFWATIQGHILRGPMVEGRSGSGKVAEVVELPPPRLLGAFDPILHGWASRDFIIPREQDRRVVTVNGIFKPTILVEGQVVGTWTMPDGKVKLEPFRRLSTADRAALGDEAAAIDAYLG